MDIIFKPIGYIKSPFKELKHIPNQSIYARHIKATLEISSEYVKGIRNIKAGNHIIVLFNFHKSKGYKLLERPKGHKLLGASEDPHSLKGIFSTRSPNRPNALGMSIVKVIKVHNNVIEIEGVDMLDGTPIIDIKPYVPKLNPHEEENPYLNVVKCK